ncbi:hypothetical protein GCM10023091_08190 [Ravibacter arvi]|uniref:LysM domain-containing protein n=1 Tax=Ravibacter arvi TaxID=2051041 RepID=A0ABP8LRU6_9BACT
MKKLNDVRLVSFSFAFAVFVSLGASAQQQAEEEASVEITEDTATVVSAIDLVPEIGEEQADSQVAPFILKDRFKYLQNEIPMRYNEHSHRYVDFFIDKRPSFTRRMLETKVLYFPIFEKALAAHNLPDELKYLPLIESGLDPRVISRAGAGGLWQFMRATGREFGLEQNQCIDERFHPEKSTQAACRYLRQLHNIFGDWEMALAAYNCGPGNVRRAIRRTGKSDFWGIYPVLPKETRNYVPQFVAMIYLMHYGKDHGIVPSELKLMPAADTIQVKGYLNLRTFAALGGFTMEDIYEQNPQLVGTYLPQSNEGFSLKIPAIKAALMADNLVAILDSSSKVTGDPGMQLADERSVRDGYELVSSKVRHTVRSGQTLSSIARQHGVTVAQLKAANRIKGSRLQRGQRLVIVKTVRRRLPDNVQLASAAKKAPAPATAVDSAVTLVAAVEAREDAEPGDLNAGEGDTVLVAQQEIRQKTRTEAIAPVNSRPAAAAKTVASTSKPRVHTIKRGESLIVIAKKYDVEVEELISFNNLKSKKVIAGKQLEIPRHEPVAEAQVAAKATAKVRDRVMYHVVQSGDTLWAISKRYGLSVDWIKKVNKIKGNALKAGMKILISG